MELQERDWPLVIKPFFQCQGFSCQPSIRHPQEWRGLGPFPRAEHVRYRNPKANPSIKGCKPVSANRATRQNRAEKALPGTMVHYRGNLRLVFAKPMLEPGCSIFIATKLLYGRPVRWLLGPSIFPIDLGLFHCTSAYISAKWQSPGSWKAPHVSGGTDTMLRFVWTWKAPLSHTESNLGFRAQLTNWHLRLWNGTERKKTVAFDAMGSEVGLHTQTLPLRQTEACFWLRHGNRRCRSVYS
ncbi:hypothetical protein LX36DRAFT_414455 [Colletotrichum falcatum]|nr:hypothetical protein LX36DRAFT_414455 [Colletotrichum falcatum]